MIIAKTLPQWIEYLNWLHDHPRQWIELRVICDLLGHEPSGEQFMTAIPTDVCIWCAAKYQVKP